MKKLLSIVLLFLFLITNSGIAVTAHWCCGELSSIHFIAADKHRCTCGDNGSCDNKAMESGCCKDKTTTLNANEKNDVAKAADFELKVTTPDITFIPVNHIEVLSTVIFHNTVSDFYHPPPPNHSVPLYLLDKVFRI